MPIALYPDPLLSQTLVASTYPLEIIQLQQWMERNNNLQGQALADAITICRGFVEAQHEYAAEKHDGAFVNQYAQRIISSPGKQDGLAREKRGWHMGRPRGRGNRQGP